MSSRAIGYHRTRGVVLALGLLAISAGPAAVQSVTENAVVVPILWRDPGDITSKNLFWGNGSPERRPQAPFTFIRENMSGTVPKVVVCDARGDLWDVKFGVERHTEIAANRLLWALGYGVEEMYYVSEGVLQGARDLKRADKEINPGGRFAGARFRRRDPLVSHAGGWSFSANPFTGSQEMSGLVILMTMLNNWDISGPRNNEILQVTTPEGNIERWYIVQDLGAAFGRWKGPSGTPIKWSLRDFQDHPFIVRVEADRLLLAYEGYDPAVPRDVPLEHRDGLRVWRLN